MDIPDPTSLLFLDIETVPLYASFDALSVDEKEIWTEKVKHQISEEKTAGQLYEDRAGVMAEFSKIVCVTCGFITEDQGRLALRLKSIFNQHEETLLEQLVPVLNSVGKGTAQYLCAHNGKEFDFPFIARRLLIYQMQLPKCLDLAGKKPWEVPHIDTMELWKFGDRKAYTSLKLLTHILGLPSPKEDISGADVKNVYYQDNDLERIARYCEKDVASLAAVYLKLRNRGETCVPKYSL